MASRAFQGQRELRWIELGECVVTYLEADVAYDDRLWDTWLEALDRPSIRYAMLCSWGPTQPSHQQWRRATRLLRDRRMSAAVVTEARHNLALAKAASWLGTNVQSFRWPQLGEACDFVGFSRADKPAHKSEILALRDRFGLVTTTPVSGSEPTLDASRYTGSNPLAVSSELVLETSSEIQTKLAEIQARLRERERVTGVRT